MKPLISVIIPVYKVEKFLVKCIESVVNQTYDNLEIILVDDGSPDTCGDICEKYRLKDQRIIVIHKKNGGLSDARNSGIDIAKGEYITFIDSDDYVAEDYIEYLYYLINEDSADISMLGAEIVKEDVEYKLQVGYSKDKLLLTPSKAMEKMLLKNGVSNTAWGKLFKSSIWRNRRFTKGIWYEDYDIMYTIYSEINKCVYGKEKKYAYLVRQGSIMQSEFNDKELTLLELSDRVTAEIIAYDKNLTPAAYRLNLILYCKVLKDIMDVKYSYLKDVQDKITQHVRINSKYIRGSKIVSIKDKIKVSFLCTNKFLFYLVYKINDLI